MKTEIFQKKLLKMLQDDLCVLQTDDKSWVVKGFIDVYKNIYTISVDSKVVSKIIELMLFPTIQRFAKKFNLKMILAKHQNHYPDITFIDEKDSTVLALDIKSTYRVNSNKINGFTLGAFTGYFRNRDSNKNITLPYDKYTAHLVLGVIYDKHDTEIDEKIIHSIDDLDKILSVVSNFEFILQEKYKLANSRTGSGNTKNIGSITDINNLKSGLGPFAKLGIDCFDDYWMYYLTKDMAPEHKTPYSNLKEYVLYKSNIPNLDLINEFDEEEIEEQNDK